MKKILLFVNIVTIFISVTSCSVEKRHYRNGYNFSLSKLKNTHLEKNEVYKNSEKTEVKQIQSLEKVNDLISSTSSELIISKKQEPTYITNTLPEDCDIVIFKNGNEIKAKVIEIGLSEIKYKRCDNIEGPLVIINKSDVFKIKYPNGTEELIVTKEKKSERVIKSNEDTSAQKTNLLTTISLILGILSIFTFIIGIFGIGAIITGALGLKEIKNNPNRYKGKDLGLVGIILGSVTLLLFLLIILIIASV